MNFSDGLLASGSTGMISVDIVERRSFDDAFLTFIIGPGGAGKSTLGRHLAPMIQRDLVDLDQEFCDRIGQIDDHIRNLGYRDYKRANSRLAQALVASLSKPTLLITSSGFRSTDNPADVLLENKRLTEQGYSLSLLPAADLDAATDIIVERQMRRGFFRDQIRERTTIRERFGLYKSAGDMLVISAASASDIARTVAMRLRPVP